MKNKKKKPASSYLLLFLSIIAVILIIIILYLSFRENGVFSKNILSKNNSSSQQQNPTASDEAGFISGDEGTDTDTSNEEFISGNELFEKDLKAGESMGPVQVLPEQEEATVPYQTPEATSEPAGPAQASEAGIEGTDSSHTAEADSKDASDSSQSADSPGTPSNTPADNGMISPSHGDSAFANKSDEKMDTLTAQITVQLPAGNGSWSVYICDLAGGSEATINNIPMQAASLIKLFIMGAVYENYDSLSQQYGADTLNSYLTPMITVSDNEAANSLVSCLGGGDSAAGMQKVNSFCQAHGYTSTSMGRLLLASNEFGDNYTSAYDCGKFLKEIYQICSGTAATSGLSHADDMYALLKQQQRNNKIPAALPEGVSVAHKTGELSDVENDAGILYNTSGQNDLVLCFLSQNLSSAGDAQNTIARLSRSIYLYYND